MFIKLLLYVTGVSHCYRLVGMTGGPLSSRQEWLDLVRRGWVWSGMARMEGCGHNQYDIEVCPLALVLSVLLFI